MRESTGVSGPLGIEVESLERWFSTSIDDVEPSLEFERVIGGHSCLTYVVTDSRHRRYVLRRPPIGELRSSAHNVLREHDIMAALAESGVPVPRMLGRCDDDAVTGAPFFVMQYVDGVVIHTADDADAHIVSLGSRARIGSQLIDALVALHETDVSAIGLGHLAGRTGYVDRQLKRWSAQLVGCPIAELDGMGVLHDWLVDNKPSEKAQALTHGDFRLGNALIGPTGSVLAILDWELCTVGEPLADLAYFIRSWTTPDTRSGRTRTPADLPGFASSESLVQTYAERSGRSMGDLPYWLAFTAWRAAALLGDVYRRYVDGAMGDKPSDLSLFPNEVRSRMQQGMAHAGLSA
jgi:aminoglycoside phosphotransferase (APT) family kinase protein